MAASAPLHQKPLTSSGSQPGREEVRSCVRRHWETSAGFWEANCFLSVSARRLRRDEMFLSVSNSSRRKFWAADERCGSIVEVPKRRETKPIVSLSSLTKSHISGSYFVFCKGGKKYPDFDFSCCFFSTIGPYGNPIISECTPRPVSACAVWSYVYNDVDIFSTLASNLLIRRTWFTFCILLSPLFQTCAARKWALPFCPWCIFIYEGSAYMVQCEFCWSSLFATFLTLKSRGTFAYYFFSFKQERFIRLPTGQITITILP